MDLREDDKDSDHVPDHTNLSEMFDAGFEMYNNINKSKEPTNSPKIQAMVKRTMAIFEKATKLVSLADIFSTNENFEEVSTENIKYFLLPALLGMLTTKICEPENRMHILDVTEIYFVDFLKRLKAYGIIDHEIPEIKHDEDKDEKAVVRQKSNAELIVDMVSSRNTKIERFNEYKRLDQRLEMLKDHLQHFRIDDEVKRDYFLTLVQVFANKAVEELASVAAERPILEHMKKIGHNPEESKKEQKHKIPSAKLTPIIITRDELQKKVYGLGYPSLPVMTVEEFYDKKVKDGEWPETRNQIGGNSLQDVASGVVDESLQKDKEDEEKERKIENDDPETLARARAMDEYKDTHRRGWGNRANRS